MGKHKRNGVGEPSFVPKISSVSRKLASRRLEQLNLGGGVPHFMRDIKCRVPLAPIPDNTQEENADAKLLDEEITKILNEENNKIATEGRTPTSKQVLKPIAMSKQPSVVLDDNVFTFRPKVSTASAKIVENMGTDFMSRQQQHLEKQKKFVEKGGFLQYKGGPGHLSPLSQYRRLKERGFKPEENENVNANSHDSDTGAPPDSPTTDRPEDQLSDTMSIPSLHRNKTSLSQGLQRILDGPYSNGNPDMVLKRHKSRIRAHHLKGNKSVGDTSDIDDLKGQSQPAPAQTEQEDDIENGSLSRSKTMPSLGRPKLTRKITSISNSDRLKNAKELAEKAIKMKKVFTIQGGYSAVRACLRKRGWVEKFYRIPGPQKKSKRKHRKGGDDDDDDADDDDDDDDTDTDTDSDNDQPKVPPWEEDDGIYGIMSRMVRNVNPTFIWVLKRDVIDYRFLTKDQMVNHYCKAGSFTTKVGLCVNMRQVPWFDESDPDEFYPRCYRLSHEEEKAAFIDDYRLTACMNILKHVINQYMEGGECNEENREKEIGDKGQPEPQTPFICTNPECTRSRPNMTTENPCAHMIQRKADEELRKREKSTLSDDDDQGEQEVEYDENGVPKPLESSRKKKKKRVIVPQKALDRAIIQCDKYLSFRNHDDIDQQVEHDALTAAQWDELIAWSYQLVHEGGLIPNVPANILGQVENILNRIKAVWPQYDLDGMKNIWIVKPGAKSRGRGIVCYDRLDDMLKLVNSQVVRKDNKYVVQKYMERPLLIYNCKFDIRQWFLVTDWNPLTIYFYQDSYLRFCSQEFTLEDYDESIHLSNNAIQKHYKNGPRAPELPAENMWTHEQFQNYIKSKKLGNLWDDLIYPGMKKAIICSLLSTQDLVEYRKSSFELYGADFMLTEDYHPWLIEINSSPSMESSTDITSRLCSSVLEDTLKVVVDRKWDRNCDIGRFELAYKQPLVTVPPYIGISMCAEGGGIKRPSWMNVKKNTDNDSVFSPRKQEKQVIFNDKLVSSSIEPTAKTAGNLRRPQNDNGHEDTVGKKHSSSAPVKKSTSRETNQESSGNVRVKKVHKQNSSGTSSHSTSQSNSNTSVMAEKSPSESNSVYSHHNSEPSRADATHSRADATHNRADINDTENIRPEKRKISPPVSPTVVPKTSMFGSDAIPTTSYVANINTKKMVSRTSVSTNYTIPGTDSKDRPSLSVNNVETTDLKTLKAQAKGVYPLTESTWARTCLDCGNGMNLHLDITNPFCKCRKDGIRVSPEPCESKVPRAKSARNVTRPQSRVSPRPPSAFACSNPQCSSTGGNTKITITNSVGSNGKNGAKKVLLRYTDAGIQRPLTQQYSGTNALPHLVRRYIGRRVGQYHQLSVSQNSAIFIDTSQLNGALSIVSHGFYSK